MKDITETPEFEKYAATLRGGINNSGLISHLRLPPPVFADMMETSSAEIIRAAQLGHAAGIAEAVGESTPPPAVPPVSSAPENPFSPTLESNLLGWLGDPRKYKHHDWFNWPEGLEAVLYTRDGAQMTDHDNDGKDDHRVNVYLVDAVDWALAELLRRLGKAEFFRQGWHVFGGGVNVRSKKGGSGWSTHSWGLALDFNPNENVFYASSTTFTHAAIEIWHEAGFYWGPYAWGCPEYQAKHRRGGRQENLWIDPMHVQAVKPRIYEGTYYETQGFPNG